MNRGGLWGMAIFALVLLIGLEVWWQVYKFHDCLRVGHTRTYCWLDGGK